MKKAVLITENLQIGRKNEQKQKSKKNEMTFNSIACEMYDEMMSL